MTVGGRDNATTDDARWSVGPVTCAMDDGQSRNTFSMCIILHMNNEPFNEDLHTLTVILRESSSGRMLIARNLPAAVRWGSMVIMDAIGREVWGTRVQQSSARDTYQSVVVCRTY